MNMLTNYIKTAVRHIWHNKLYSFINVSGLAIGISCVLLAVLYIKDERSFDKFHEKKDNLYRVVTNVTNEKGERKAEAGTGQPQGPAFKEAVPEIADFVRVMGGDIKGDVIANNKTLNLQMLFADENFFGLFSFPLLRGDGKTALNDISSVVITETVARKYFNSIDVVGKTMVIDGDPSAKRLGKPMQITGVSKDIPKNSSIRFEILLPMRFLQLSFTDNAWLNQYLGTFLLLQPGAKLESVIQKFDKVYAVHAKDQVAESKRLYNYDPKISFGLQHITQMHLNPMRTGTGGREGGIVNESDPVFSYLFLGIALFILLMAGINFINISIASSLKRAKEVGVRKISGGSKQQIIFQFLFESAIVCVIAFGLAVFLSYISLSLFNELSGKQILFKEIVDWSLIGWFAAILFIIILLTGFYPAYVLSAFKPKEVLYNKQKLSGRNIFGRALVVVQFGLAVFFIITTFIYYRQMDFIRTKDLGYDPFQVIRTDIPGAREYKPVQEFLRNELSKNPSIQYVSFGGGGGEDKVKVGDKVLDAENHVIDEYRLPVMQIKLKAGRNISSAFPSDKAHAVLVNEAFVKAAGLSSPIGTQIQTSEYYDKEPKTIVGVIENFHSGSLRHPIKPMVMFVSDWASGGIWIRIEKGRQQKALAAIEAAYKKAMPTALFQYNFLDELNAKEYIQEQRWQRIIGVATVLSIVICCLGLFGLAHLAAQRRIKEIGIRKVLGASVTSIASLLTKDFLRLVVTSLLIASPLAWWVMNNWLQDFAYRIAIGWWIFALSGLITIVIAMATVSFQAIKAAIANPVKSLRTE
ncbi:MAG: ABC transporter permease [Chitinophagaceae bacterium]